MDEIELLRQQYVDGLPARLSALERAREGLRAAAPAARSEGEAAVRRVAHGLRGTGTSYGFPQITRAAAECEDAPAGPLLLGAAERLAAVLRGLQPSTVAATVVVVEDDPDLGRLIERVLTAPGRRVLLATRAAELEPLLQRHDVSLVVLDLVLPDADGREVLARLREAPRTAATPVVVVTARATALTRAECAALGAEVVLEKPLDEGVLRATVAGRLRRVHEAETRSGVASRAGLRAAHGRAPAGPIAVLSIAIEGLDPVTRARGAPGAEALVQRTLHLLAQALGTGAVVARWGPREVAALLPGADATSAARRLAAATAAVAAASLGVAVTGGVADGREPPGGPAGGDVLDQALAAAAAAARQVATPRADAQPAVLVVDDDDDHARLVEHRLRREGLAVRRARDGLDAVRQARAALPALVLLDVQMPLLDGFGVLERLRADPATAGVPIILVTSLGREADVVRGLDLGADDYLVKPVSPVELSARVRRQLRRGAPPRAAEVQRPAGALAGTYAGDQLVELVQMLGLGNKTGLLRIEGDAVHGLIAFRDGRVVGARASRPGLAGAELALGLLTTRSGSFEFTPGLPGDAPADLSLAVEGLLLEAVRRRDEAGQAAPG